MKTNTFPVGSIVKVKYKHRQNGNHYPESPYYAVIDRSVPGPVHLIYVQTPGFSRSFGPLLPNELELIRAVNRPVIIADQLDHVERRYC